MVVIIDSVAIDIISSWVIESESCQAIKTNWITGNCIVIIGAEVHAIFSIIGNSVALDGIIWTNNHNTIVGVSKDPVVVSNDGPAAIFQDHPWVVVLIDLVFWNRWMITEII